MARVTCEFSPYNTRRYGKPWIAKVTEWQTGKRPELDWGQLVGLTAEIDASPGDVIRWGQKDHRGRNSEALWGIVQSDLSVVQCTPEHARQHWIDGRPVPVVEAEASPDNVVAFRTPS